jgi:penicillin-binding protein 2
MANAYAAIANGGKLWQPFVVRRIEGGSSGEIDEMKGKLKRTIPVDARYFQIVQKGLYGVVQDDRGTAHSAIKDRSIPIAGKTGTAQVVKLAENANRKLAARMAKLTERDHAWFVAYAPAGDPKIAVAVLVEHGGHGSSTAAPLAQRVIAAYLKNNSGPAQ